VAAVGRVDDVKRVVTKEFKRPGNRLVLVGRCDPEVLGGTVYADCFGERGDRLFDAYDAASVRAQWDGLLRTHAARQYVSGSAIAEGGILLRLFEAVFGSGLGARVELDGFPPGRRDSLLFGEFIGSCLIEVSPDSDLSAQLAGIPYRILGQVTEEPRLTLAERGAVVWEEATAQLAETWSQTFREVVK
jgi:phosphoribosylformylglycinamidine synthase